MVTTVLGGRIAFTRRNGILAGGDALAIAVFVAVGELQHGGTLAAGVGTYAEFAAGWVLAAAVLGVYGASGNGSRTRRLGRPLIAWVIAAVLAQGIRIAAGTSSGVAPAFLAVSIGAGGALLLAWRLVAGSIEP